MKAMVVANRAAVHTPRIPCAGWILKVAAGAAIISAGVSFTSEARKSIDAYQAHAQAHRAQLATQPQ